jgi:hypothetical protein
MPGHEEIPGHEGCNQQEKDMMDEETQRELRRKKIFLQLQRSMGTRS